jgi:hypothetical protein
MIIQMPQNWYREMPDNRPKPPTETPGDRYLRERGHKRIGEITYSIEELNNYGR